MLCAKFGRNWHIGSWEEDENMKSLQIDRRSDGAFSSGELKGKKQSQIVFVNIIVPHRLHDFVVIRCNTWLYASVELAANL